MVKHEHFLLRHGSSKSTRGEAATALRTLCDADLKEIIQIAAFGFMCDYEAEKLSCSAPP